jgi:Predicted membrane protein
MTLEDAVSRVRRRVEGRVLSAEEHDGEYRVRVLTPEGRVKRFRLDRRSGRFR